MPVHAEQMGPLNAKPAEATSEVLAARLRHSEGKRMNNIEAQLYGAFAAREKRQRGGSRPGAGRKPGPNGTKVKRNIALTPDVWAFLVSTGQTAGETIETRTRGCAAFKAWLKARLPSAG